MQRCCRKYCYHLWLCRQHFSSVNSINKWLSVVLGSNFKLDWCVQMGNTDLTVLLAEIQGSHLDSSHRSSQAIISFKISIQFPECKHSVYTAGSKRPVTRRYGLVGQLGKYCQFIPPILPPGGPGGWESSKGEQIFPATGPMMKEEQSKLLGDRIERKPTLLVFDMGVMKSVSLAQNVTPPAEKNQAFSLKSWDLTWFSSLSMSLPMQKPARLWFLSFSVQLSELEACFEMKSAIFS